MKNRAGSVELPFRNSVELPSKEEEIVGSAERHHSTLLQAIVKLGFSRLSRQWGFPGDTPIGRKRIVARKL